MHPSPWRRGLCRVPVDQLLQLLTGLKVGDAPRRHVHSVAGPGVAAAAPETETAEAAEFDPLPLLQRRRHVAEHGVDADFGALLREAGSIGHLLDERRLRYAAPGTTKTRTEKSPPGVERLRSRSDTMPVGFLINMRGS